MDPQPGPAADVDVRGLTALELGAVVRNDTDTYPLAGRVEVPAVLEELERRASLRDARDRDVTDRERAESLAAVAVLDELKAEAEANVAGLEPERPAGEPTNGVDPNAHPHNDRILAANGFALIREKCMTAAGAVPPPPALEAAIRYLKASRSQAQVGGAQRAILDALDTELGQFEATLKYARNLRAIQERAEARASIAAAEN